MDRSYLRALRDAEAQRIVDALSAEQFLHPHRSLGEAVSEAGNQVGFCPKAAGSSMHWLQLDGTKPIGRLRRCEMLQLARSIRRIWRQNAPQVAEAST